MTAFPSLRGRSPFAELGDEIRLRGLSKPVAAGVDIESVGHIGVLVQRQRKKLSLTQSQLADRAGVGRRFLSELEAGKATIRASELMAVCVAAGLTLNLRVADWHPDDAMRVNFKST